jgi:structural maintenance of chromosomes protein 6
VCGSDFVSTSGGERSYTTMCLLLALGEFLETPFRILDEFDVFLDGATRKLTIQMLIHLAKTKMEHRQFIFITPQDLSGITPDPQLKILKLKPPTRRAEGGGAQQQTLDFTQQ